jgi:fused signal recognition particle receptor
VETTAATIDQLKEKVKKAGFYSSDEVISLLKKELLEQLSESENRLDVLNFSPPLVILMVGVNGTGKTTTIGKLAHYYRRQGRTVTLAAADTFRAAAIDQLASWANRTNSNFISHQRGSDSAAVVFDSIASAKSKGIDYTIVDTAGRLHTYVNLMEELKKIKRVAARQAHPWPLLTLLVVDATTGQNGIAQAKQFNQALEIDGLALAKLDSSAKGGVAFAIEKQLKIPIVLVGIGEQLEDLQSFSAPDYVNALIG